MGQVLFDGWPADVDRDGDVDLVGSHAIRNLATGPIRVGATKHLPISGVAGPALAHLALGAKRAELPDFPLPSVTFLLDPSALTIVPLSITASGLGLGAASATIPVFLPQGLQGAEACEQVFVFDPGAPSGVSATNGLQVQIGK